MNFFDLVLLPCKWGGVASKFRAADCRLVEDNTTHSHVHYYIRLSKSSSYMTAFISMSFPIHHHRPPAARTCLDDNIFFLSYLGNKTTLSKIHRSSQLHNYQDKTCHMCKNSCGHAIEVYHATFALAHGVIASLKFFDILVNGSFYWYLYLQDIFQTMGSILDP